MKFLYLIIFYSGIVFCDDAIIQIPEYLTFEQLEKLNDVFNFANVDENIESFDQLDLNFLKRIETSFGYIDDEDTFKLIPCENYFSLFKKINGVYSYIGKILYPNKYKMPTSINVTKNGNSFMAIFSKFDKKAEEYDYKLFVWLKDKQNNYRRYDLGYLHQASMSRDGSTIIGYHKDLFRLFYWKLIDDEFELKNDVLKLSPLENPLISLNDDGSRFFVLEQGISSGNANSPLRLNLIAAENNGDAIEVERIYTLNARKALGDLNATGDILLLYIESAESKINESEESFYKLGKSTELFEESGKLIIINLKEPGKKPDLLLYAKINKKPDRLKIESGINSLMIGFKDYFDLYQFKLPELQKIKQNIEEKISCQDLLANIEDQSFEQPCNE